MAEMTLEQQRAIALAKARMRADQKVDVQPKISEEPGIKEKIEAGLYGGVTGLAGGLGELEKFGAYTVPEFFGLREPGQREKMAFGRETIFPTVKEAEQVLSKVGIKPPPEELSGYRTAGEIIGGLGSTLPRALRAGSRALLGTPTRTTERYARQAERLGFQLSPAQTRAIEPIGSKGATGFSEANQTLANRLASRGTGREVSEVSPSFLRERFDTLGRQFDNLYQGRQFNIDQPALQAIRDIRDMSEFLGQGKLRRSAEQILQNYAQMAARPGAASQTFAIAGDALQGLRNDLAAAARSTTNRGNAHEIYNFIDAIDDSIARNHPAISAQLQALRPQYRNTIVLEDLMARRGVQGGNVSLENLGEMLGRQRGGVRRNQDIDRLGEMGRELRLRALWQKEGAATAGEQAAGAAAKPIVGSLAGKAAAATGLRSRPARVAQRTLTRPSPREALERPAAAAGAGAVIAPMQREEE